VAETIEAAGCSQRDVQEAIDAARDGDVVEVPAAQSSFAVSAFDAAGNESPPSTAGQPAASTPGAEARKERPSTYGGWKAHVLENDLVRLHAVPAIGGRVIQYALGEKEFFWVNPTLAGRTSPQTGLDPDGGWLNYYRWRYEWCACRIGGDFPVVDCSEAGVVSEPLAWRREGRRVRLRGRFGVFHPGRLVLEAHDAKREVLATENLVPAATPLEAVVLDRAIELPAATRSVALILQDADGKRIGEIAR
jgi:hypothetical protein